jgi:GDP-mannose pyrophosphatase NudK
MMKVTDGGGMEHEEENIEVLELSIEKTEEMMKSGEIRDAKTIMLLQYALLNNLF